MSFSYSGDPAHNAVDEVRFLLGDIAAPGLLSNEEISYWLVKLQDTYSNNIMTAAYCADVVAARYASEVSINADGVTYSGEQLQQKFNTLAGQLRTMYGQLQSVGSGPFAGGTDIRGPWMYGVLPLNFGVGQYDNDRAGWQRNHRPYGEIPYETDDVAGSWP